jgi:hypothetical protein
MQGHHRQHGLLIRLAALAPALGLSCSPPALADPDRPVPPTVHDLAWGEVLFDFYQDDYVPAITRLLAARERGELIEHADEAELVLGGLYLDYGLHRQAAVIFERLLDERASPPVRDQAWFFLARIRYARGDAEGAALALGEIGDALPARLDPERYDLQARVLLARGQSEDAARLLARAELPGGWRYFGQFNLGVALIRSGAPGEGEAWLERVGAARVAGPELTTLRDRANLALGYERLLAGNAAGARAALDRVSLDGPYTTRALLAAGWAEAGQEDYRRALTPWLALGDFDRLDVAVQESLLAVPYAYDRLGASLQAVEHYQRAVDAYEAEVLRIDAARRQIEAGGMTAAVLREDGGSAADTGATIGRYLEDLLAEERFLVVVEELRATGRLRRLLEARADSIEAFGDMLDAQRRRYAGRRPEALAATDEKKLDGLRARHEAQTAALASIRANADVMALTDPRERRLAARLAAVREAADGPGGDAAAAARARFLSGVLYWQVHADFPARLRRAQKTAAATGRTLADAEQRLAAVRAAARDEPDEYRNFDQRIAAAAGRLETLRRRTRAVILAQSRFLEDLAVAELLARRERVTEYLGQARFALAASYDRAAVAEAGP